MKDGGRLFHVWRIFNRPGAAATHTPQTPLPPVLPTKPDKTLPDIHVAMAPRPVTKLQKRSAQHISILLRQFSKITGLTKFLAGFTICTAFIMSVQAQANVTLAWSPSSDPIVAGFNIYYGGASGVYTNKTSVGMVTSLMIPNLVIGATYYFAETTYSAAGAESALSGEVAYTVPMPSAGLQLGVTPARQFVLTMTGPVGHKYDIQATQDFKTWTVIGKVKVGSNGSFSFTDKKAAKFSKRFYRTRE
jgi:hypothetical protein